MNFWKNRVNLALLAVMLLSAALCVGFWFWDITWLLYLPAIPFFCLQLLLCRMERWKPLRAAPLVLLAAVALWGGWICLTWSGWDALLGVILLLGAISPAVGSVLAWAVWGFLQFRKRRKSHG